MSYDVIVVGAGPAGLAFVRGLAGTGLRVALIDRQPLSDLIDPAPDGRAIALTHRSVDSLRTLGAWTSIDPAAVSLLRSASVLDGASSFALPFGTQDVREDHLGTLVGNHHIRRALFAVTAGQPGLTIFAGVATAAVSTDRRGATVTLENGRSLRGHLLVAADSRFSDIRARLGIAARVNRLGRSMLLAEVEHDLDHRGIATEWFDYGQTIALLPLAGRRSSVVLTLPEDAIARLASWSPTALSTELTRRSGEHLGTMRMTGRSHVYPLATTWSEHFAATRAALIGDAAVGMHPVTAHGFNLGLRSAVSLSRLVGAARARRHDIGGSLLLRRYEAAHRMAAAPLFAATGAIVRLYTDEHLPARLVRPTLLRAAGRMPLVRSGVSRMLMHR
ncbi:MULTISPECIES: 5-demethoxyubiquinol-8 5-hydroxylase UbiM [unclassified Sphingomonas]|uniref:5-demethoxyubiquinol-8 5-hydroxylase UbiM n=1 Tax=unclassified Sphingomonas TaxID=196159 RepID=UPI00226A082E|nr:MULTISPECIES: 5-demethoxyubiquinol-8 5-hydroxylase UbiM [unclassified Sphingomonas]